MIVCICKGASDRDVAAAIDAGARCVDDLHACGIGGDCFGCERTLIRMIAERAGHRDDVCPNCRDAAAEPRRSSA